MVNADVLSIDIMSIVLYNYRQLVNSMKRYFQQHL